MIYKLILIFIININFLNAQVFENKRDLLENSENTKSNKLYIGLGVSYFNNEIINKSSVDYKINSNIINGYNFVPNLLLEYVHSESSDFRFKLNIVFNPYSFEDNYNYITETFQNDIKVTNYNYASSKLNLNSFDFDLIVSYNLLGFKSVSLFSGMKIRIPDYKINYEVYSITDQGIETNRNLELVYSKINYAPVLGVSYNGMYGFIEYELYFQYISFLNDIDFNDNLNTNLTSFSNSQYGLGVNLKYNLIKRK